MTAAGRRRWVRIKRDLYGYTALACVGLGLLIAWYGIANA